MKIHARFRLDEVTRIKLYMPGDDGKGGKWVFASGVRVKFSPVQGEPFGSATTPGGQLEMVIANPEAAAVFNNAELYQEFDAVFSPVESIEKA